MYQHILLATDLAEDNLKVVSKAIALAKTHQAKLSLVNIIYKPEAVHAGFPGMINLNSGELDKYLHEEKSQEMDKLIASCDYPCAERLLISGDLVDGINDAIQQYQVDLLVCGHHHTLLSLFSSSARRLMNHVHCDLLVVPLLDK